MMLAKSLQSAAGNAAAEAVYIEDVMSTFLYTGNDSTQTITNGIDLAGEGGLVWIKQRDLGRDHVLYDTSRGASNALTTNSTAAQATGFGGVSAFSSSGFTLNNFASEANALNGTYASWTFRKQPKFFDVVTYTGNGTTSRTIAHNLGSVPGCIIVKRTDASSNWAVYHRSIGATNALILQGTNAQFSSDWFGVTPTSSNFYLSDSDTAVNANGGTYVAYLFAHDAGGFGLSGEDNVISCGSYTGSASDVAVTLGYEAQWVLVKNTTTAANWQMLDIMRGMPLTGTAPTLAPNLSNAESNQTAPVIVPTATGFRVTGGLGFALNYEGDNYIYIAIRRGPMKVPESGTSVFEPDLSPNSNNPRFVSGFPVDMAMSRLRTSDGVEGMDITSRLTHLQYMRTGSTNAEATSSTIRMDYMNGFDNDGDTSPNWVAHMFRRAPSVFDVVCYTGTGANTTQAHNLAAAPEMMIVKKRSSATASDWYVYHSGMVDLTYPNPATQYIRLNLTNNWVRGSSGAWNNTQPTSSVFSLGDTSATNASGQTFVAYLFATLAGVSKVGSYTGNGSSQTINCGFTAGARFVLIKAASTTGDWLVADSARGIVSGNDPYLELNTTNAEVTGEDWLDTGSSGFVVNNVSGSNANTNGVTYIYLAIA